MKAFKIITWDPARDGLSRITGKKTPSKALQRVAAALSADPRLERIRFVVRDTDEPALYAFGEPDTPATERLHHLSLQAHRVHRAARYVGYVEAERLTARLAAELIGRYGRDDVRSFAYQGIPRGGVIVLGMLSYALDLPPAALAPPADETAPLVLVDDCVISGVRFRQQWDHIGSRRLILATLFAPDDFCSRIVSGADTSRKPARQFEHVSAVTLPDLAQELYGNAYGAWYSRWQERQEGQGLWIGQPEHLCFAWSEPESSFYNAATGELERGFSFVPAGRCLRARHQTTDRLSVPKFGRKKEFGVQIQRDGTGPVRVPPWVVSARLDTDRTAVASFADGGGENARACFLLEGTAADMWRSLIDEGTIAGALHALQQLYAIDPVTLSADLTSFCTELLDRGLLSNG